MTTSPCNLYTVCLYTHTYNIMIIIIMITIIIMIDNNNYNNDNNTNHNSNIYIYMCVCVFHTQCDTVYRTIRSSCVTGVLSCRLCTCCWWCGTSMKHPAQNGEVEMVKRLGTIVWLSIRNGKSIFYRTSEQNVYELMWCFNPVSRSAYCTCSLGYKPQQQRIVNAEPIPTEFKEPFWWLVFKTRWSTSEINSCVIFVACFI